MNWCEKISKGLRTEGKIKNNKKEGIDIYRPEREPQVFEAARQVGVGSRLLSYCLRPLISSNCRGVFQHQALQRGCCCIDRATLRMVAILNSVYLQKNYCTFLSIRTQADIIREMKKRFCELGCADSILRCGVQNIS